MTKLFALILVTLAAALGVTRCGGDDDDGGGGSQNSGQAAETDTGGGGGTTGGGAEVSMKNIEFDPSDISVKAGETITFTNDEAVAHDVHKTSGPGKDFASGPAGGMQQGDTFEQALERAGRFDGPVEADLGDAAERRELPTHPGPGATADLGRALQPARRLCGQHARRGRPAQAKSGRGCGPFPPLRAPGGPSRLTTSTKRSATSQWFSRSEKRVKPASGRASAVADALIQARSSRVARSGRPGSG